MSTSGVSCGRHCSVGPIRNDRNKGGLDRVQKLELAYHRRIEDLLRYHRVRTRRQDRRVSRARNGRRPRYRLNRARRNSQCCLTPRRFPQFCQTSRRLSGAIRLLLRRHARRLQTASGSRRVSRRYYGRASGRDRVNVQVPLNSVNVPLMYQRLRLNLNVDGFLLSVLSVMHRRFLPLSVQQRLTLSGVQRLRQRLLLTMGNCNVEYLTRIFQSSRRPIVAEILNVTCTISLFQHGGTRGVRFRPVNQGQIWGVTVRSDVISRHGSALLLTIS